MVGTSETAPNYYFTADDIILPKITLPIILSIIKLLVYNDLDICDTVSSITPLLFTHRIPNPYVTFPPIVATS